MDIYKFLENNWTIAIIGGTLATVLSAILIRMLIPKKMAERPKSNSQKTVIINKINSGDIDVKSKTMDPSVTKIINNNEISHYKEYAKILFIDDLDFDDKINNLIDAGWKNVGLIKNADNIDRREIREADVVFVDYRGIGKACKDQGMSVVSALKSRYKNTKWIILYSAHKVPLRPALNSADGSLAKNSSIYEFEQKIVEGLGVINK